MNQASPIDVLAAAQSSLPSDSVAALEAAGAALQANDDDTLKVAVQNDEATLASVQQDNIQKTSLLSNQDGSQLVPSGESAAGSSAENAEPAFSADDGSLLTEAASSQDPGKDVSTEGTADEVQPAESAPPASASGDGAGVQPPLASDTLPRQVLPSADIDAVTDATRPAVRLPATPGDDQSDSGTLPDNNTSQQSADEDNLSAGALAASVDPAAEPALSSEGLKAAADAAGMPKAADAASLGPDTSQPPAEDLEPDLPPASTLQEEASGVSSVPQEAVPDIQQVKPDV